MRVLLTAASAGTHPQSNPRQQPCGPAPGASFLNQSNMLSLPVLTDSLRVLWVLSDQACQQLAELDIVAELVEAFNKFPYPTKGEMAALARRCSLHLDQVRVWFMIQRLRRGLSWDCEEICEVRQRLRRSGQTQGDEVEEAGQEKRGVKTSEGQGEEDSMDGKAGGEHEAEGQGVNVAEKKREGGNGDGEMMGQERGEIGRKQLGRLMDEAGKRRKARRRDKKKTETDAKKKPKKNKSKKAPVTLLREKFMTCPFPKSDDYDRLISQTGLSRISIIKWFALARFRIKNSSHPVWLTKHMCHCLRRRIKYRYKMMALAKEKVNKGKPTLKVKLEWERHVISTTV